MKLATLSLGLSPELTYDRPMFQNCPQEEFHKVSVIILIDSLFCPVIQPNSSEHSLVLALGKIPKIV